MGDELQELRKQVEELTELVNLHSQRAMDYAGMAMRKREWVGLTDDEYELMAEQCVTNCYFDTLEYAKSIEAKLKEKNT